MGVVRSFGFEQLGMGEHDAELIVQAVKEQSQFGGLVHRAFREELFDAQRTCRTPRPCGATGPLDHARFRPSSCCQVEETAAGRVASFGSRQSVSTKMRTEPPAVRTYSILPLASQL